MLSRGGERMEKIMQENSSEVQEWQEEKWREKRREEKKKK